MTLYSAELLRILHLCFGHNNLYYWRPRPEGMSKNRFRASNTSRWNSLAESTLSMGLSLNRVVEGRRYLSPTWLCHQVLEDHPEEGHHNAFTEIRTSMLLAPDDRTRWVIENHWRASFEQEGLFPVSMSFAYLLPPRV